MNSGTAVELQLPEHFSLPETLGYLARSADECLFSVEGGRVHRLLRVENTSVLAEIDGGAGRLRIRFPACERVEESVQAEAARCVREWFDLDRDLAPFYRRMERCPLMKDLALEHRGLRVVGVTDLFEALCWAIMGQQIHLPFAYALKRRFVESYGGRRQWNGRTYWEFPLPEAIAGLAVEDLIKRKFTRRKSEYILGVAKRMAEGALSKSGLMGAGDFRTAERELLKIRGVGPWTAHYVLMRCLRDPAAFPVADAGLQNAVKKRLHLDRKPTVDELRELAARWSGWEAYATFYLWRSLAD